MTDITEVIKKAGGITIRVRALVNLITVVIPVLFTCWLYSFKAANYMEEIKQSIVINDTLCKQRFIIVDQRLSKLENGNTDR